MNMQTMLATAVVMVNAVTIATSMIVMSIETIAITIVLNVVWEGRRCLGGLWPHREASGRGKPLETRGSLRKHRVASASLGRPQEA